MTKFLAGCRVCNKSGNRPFTPTRLDDTCTESSSELDALHTILSHRRTRSTGSSTPNTDSSRQEPINPLCIDNTTKEIPLPVNTPSGPTTVSESLSHLAQCTTKLAEYQQQLSTNNAGLNDLKVSNELMNYYQLLRMVYEQTLQASAVASTSKIITSTPEPQQQSVKPRSDNIPIFDLTSSQSPPKPIAAISPNMERLAFLGTTKTTPPKKRFVNYPVQADGRIGSGKCDLSNRFDSEVKTTSAKVVTSNEQTKLQESALACLDSNYVHVGTSELSKKLEDQSMTLEAVKVCSFFIYIRVRIRQLNL